MSENVVTKQRVEMIYKFHTLTYLLYGSAWPVTYSCRLYPHRNIVIVAYAVLGHSTL
jgi:hypothetical protein